MARTLIEKGLEYDIPGAQDGNPWPDDSSFCENYVSQRPLTWNTVNLDFAEEASVPPSQVHVRYYEKFQQDITPKPSTYPGAGDDPPEDPPSGYEQIQKIGDIYVEYPKFTILSQTLTVKPEEKQVFKTQNEENLRVGIPYDPVIGPAPDFEETLEPVPTTFGPLGSQHVCEVIVPGGDPTASNAGFVPKDSRADFDYDAQPGPRARIRSNVAEYEYSRVFDQLTFRFWPRLSSYQQPSCKLVGGIPSEPYFPNGRVINERTGERTPPQFPMDAIETMAPDPRPQVYVTYILTTTYRKFGVAEEFTDTVEIRQLCTQTPEAYLGQKANALAQRTYRWHGYMHNGLYPWYEPVKYDTETSDRIVIGTDREGNPIYEPLTEPTELEQLTRDDFPYDDNTPFQLPISDGTEITDDRGNRWRYNKNNGEWEAR